jgi:hypothetical protein
MNFPNVSLSLSLKCIIPYSYSASTALNLYSKHVCTVTVEAPSRWIGAASIVLARSIYYFNWRMPKRL